MVLHCVVKGSSLTTSAGYSVPQAAPDADACVVVFVKTVAGAIDDVADFRSRVVTSTLTDSLATTLAASVHRVFAPALLKGGSEGAAAAAPLALPRTAAASLGTLDTVLGSMGDGVAGTGLYAAEAAHWSGSPAPGPALAGVFEPLGARWSALAEDPSPALLLTLVNDTLATLEEVWLGDAVEGAGAFPQRRMAALMTSTSSLIAALLAEAVGSLPVWDAAAGGSMRGVVGDAVKAGSAWTRGVTSLTEEQWQVDPDRPWSGVAHRMDMLTALG